MSAIEQEIFNCAVQLLARRDYSIAKLREKLESKFGDVPDDVIQRLISKRFLNDRRFAENHVVGHKKRGNLRLRQDLLDRGIPEKTIDEVLSNSEWPSLTEALKAKMNGWHLRVPLKQRDAARLFRAMSRLGYEEDAIREEIEQLTHEQ